MFIRHVVTEPLTEAKAMEYLANAQGSNAMKAFNALLDDGITRATVALGNPAKKGEPGHAAWHGGQIEALSQLKVALNPPEDEG